MSFINSLKSKMFGSEEQTFTYECLSCGNTITSSEMDMGKVGCQECGSGRLRSV